MDTPGDFILGVGVQPITFTTSGPIFTLPAAAIPPSTGANASNIHDIHDVALPTQTTLPVTFIGANRRINLFGEDRLSGIANIYDFTGRTPSHEGLPTYQNLTYQWLYPGIDLTYSGAQGALKSTYIVAPGADPKRIQWHYQHPATVQLREDGSLAVRLASTHDTPPSLVEHAPIAWQEQFGEHIPVQVAYELAADGSISFALGAYDSTKTLLIDPSITYAYVAPTFSSGQSVKVDAQGMIYVLNQRSGGSWLLKLNPQLPADQQLIYTSDFGSAPFFAEAIDGQGNVVLAGNVAATAQAYTSINGTMQAIRGYPTRDTTGATDRDAFVVEVDSAGALIPNRLVRIGGTRGDYFTDVTVDSSGRPIVVGWTESVQASTFTINRLQESTIADANCDPASAPVPDANDCQDATIVALSADWQQVILSSPMGGDARDTASGIALSPSGDIYVSATSTSTTFLDKPGYHTSGSNCGTYPYSNMRCFDAVLAHLSPLTATGTSVVGVEYIGGEWADQASGLAVDSTGAVTIVGSVLIPATKPIGDPVFPTLNALQPEPISYDGVYGRSDGFVAKYMPMSTEFTPIYRTLLGGSFEDTLAAVAVDAAGNATVVGETSSSNILLQGDLDIPPQNIHLSDVYVAQLSATGSALRYAITLGAQDTREKGTAVTLDASGNALVSGWLSDPAVSTAFAPRLFVVGLNGHPTLPSDQVRTPEQCPCASAHPSVGGPVNTRTGGLWTRMTDVQVERNGAPIV